jgi:hypothetical protein
VTLSFEAQVERTSINSKQNSLQLHKEKEMVAFRKLFPVLAIGAFLIGTASTASAQTGTGQPLVCDTNAGVPPVVRAEGHTELVGDIVIVCTGGNPSQAFTANFQLFLNTNVTSRLIGGTSEALLMIDEPGAPRVDINGAPSGSQTPFCVAPNVTSFSAPGPTSITPGGFDYSVVGSQVPGLPAGGLFGIGNGTPATCNNVPVAPAGSTFPQGVTAGPANQTFQQGTYTVFRGQPPTPPTALRTLLSCGPVCRSFLRARTVPA